MIVKNGKIAEAADSCMFGNVDTQIKTHTLKERGVKMTCKDCPHFNVCESFDVFMPKEMKSTFDQARLDLINSKWKNCKFRNDKSRIIELPCKVGETVHYITFWKNEYNYHFITNVSYDILYQLLHEKEIGYVIYMTDDKSKAEAKLKELNGNG